MGNMEHKEESGKSFWKGVAVGLGAACVISLVTLGITYVTKNMQSLMRIVSQAEIESVADESTMEKLSLLEETIEKYFWKDVEPQQLEDGAYEGVLRALDDPYSEYYTYEELEALMQQTQGIYYGIGAYVSLDSDAGYVQITQVIEGTPAEESGLMANDYIYMVDGEDMYGKDSTYVVGKIKGEENSWVTITVIRETELEPLDIEVQRRKIESPTVEYEMLEDNMAYIQIVEFDDVTTNQFAEAYVQAQADGMEGLIIDLRSNPGGNLSTVCDICRMLLPEGLIVYTEDKYGTREEYTCNGKNEIEVPLVVLTNSYSASASEILAGAVKDYGVGKLVGTTTYGKGIVQRVINMSDGSAVKLTVSTYYTPKGNNIHEVGVSPDVEVELDAEQYLAGVDNQLEKAKEVLADMME